MGKPSSIIMANATSANIGDRQIRVRKLKSLVIFSHLQISIYLTYQEEKYIS